MEESKLADDVALLWGRRPASRRGPKASLSTDEITAAAVRVADAEGLASVSMARVAKELGFATMALYRHVRSKEELLLLMADAAFEQPPAATEDGDWRARLTSWALGLLAALRRHPWYGEIPISGPPMGPGNLAWLDRGLGAFERTRLEDSQKLAVLMGLLPLVHGQARLTRDLSSAYLADPERYDRSYGATLGSLIDPARFPALSRAVADGVFDEPSSGGGQELDEELDESFRFALTCFLDGAAVHVGAWSTGASPSDGAR